MKAGRPKKTLDDLPKGWQKKVIEAGKKGCADIVIRCNILDISNDLWCRLMDEEIIFSETITRAREYAKAWWVNEGHKALYSREINTKMYELNMMNRFGWGKNVNETNTTTVKVPSFKWDDEEDVND